MDNVINPKKKKKTHLCCTLFFFNEQKGSYTCDHWSDPLKLTIEYNNETIKGEKIIKKLLNVTKIEIYMMLILPNVMMELLNEMF